MIGKRNINPFLHAGFMLAACFTTTLLAAEGSLDPDNNGLYDDTERAALLAQLKKISPTLKSDYDVNADGMVTIQEQTAGTHPVSQLMTIDEMRKSTVVIPWSIDIFSEWITSAYLQEDAVEGALDELKVRGTIKVAGAQEDKNLRAKKSSVRGGVEFAENSGQHYVMNGVRSARWSYRWCIFTFRIDAQSGLADETIMVDVNSGKGQSRSTPKIWFHKKDGLHVQYMGFNKHGNDQRLMKSKDVVADGKTWNVLVCGIRQGRMFAELNGAVLATENTQPGRFSCEQVLAKAKTYVGGRSKENMAWAVDALVFGITEPSEAQVRKMSGWGAHRLGVQTSLPQRHPYRAKRPQLDTEDFPYRYLHDDEKWTAWGEPVRNGADTRVNAGGERVAPVGFERVFHDDFRANRIEYSTSGVGDLWMSPGFNTAVGASIPLAKPRQKPDVYAHDKENKKQTLSLAKKGNRWTASAFYSINDMGQGYTWSGPKIFRTRCFFPKVEQKDLAGGLFPAFWSYDPHTLFWRTCNRIEVDWFEFDGQNGKWYNGLASHVHYPALKNEFVKRNERYKSYKVYSNEMTEKKGKIPGGFYFWDGEYHTWEFVVDADMTYVNVTIVDENGNDKWVEVCRTKTAATYLECLDIQYDYALKSNHGIPKERQDFIVDWVEVFQKTAQVESYAAPFSAKPSLSGNTSVGSEIRCDANLKGITDIRYYWFADEYPITYGASDVHVVRAEDAGKNIRCMVKAVGANSMPDAWTDNKLIP